jgi:hypothetical protein
VLALRRDHTALLKSLGVPLTPHQRATTKALTRLPPAEWQRLVSLGLAETMEFDAGKGPERELVPRWTLKTTWHWQQTFPARAVTRVEHAYKPAIGVSAGTGLTSASVETEPWFKELAARYCTDRDFLRAAYRRHAGGATVTEQRIAYILTTGANWAGPIRDFRLVVERALPPIWSVSAVLE